MTAVIPFEQRMFADADWRLTQGSLFFCERGLVQESLQRIALWLTEQRIEHAIAGDMAMFVLGFRQHTECIEVIVEDAASIAALPASQYCVAAHNPGICRDTDSGVRIEFLIAGRTTHRNRPLPFAIPSPREVAIELNGRSYVCLECLIDLKLALLQQKLDAYAEPDVYSLIRNRRLPRTFAEKLRLSVRADYERIWDIARVAQPRMAMPWSGAKLPAEVQDMKQLVAALGSDFPELDDMLKGGVEFDPQLSRETNTSFLYTDDWFVGDRLGMHPEDEYDFNLLKRQSTIS